MNYECITPANHYYDRSTGEKVYNLTQLSEALNLGFGPYILSHYLKQLDIILPDNTARIRYLDLGYFKIDRGSRNYNSSILYKKTVTTEPGLNWLKEVVVPKILKADEEFLRHKKK